MGFCEVKRQTKFGILIAFVIICSCYGLFLRYWTTLIIKDEGRRWALEDTRVEPLTYRKSFENNASGKTQTHSRSDGLNDSPSFVDPRQTDSLSSLITTRKRSLLISSYMRSGSSITGKLFKSSSRVFYVFEPLIPLAPAAYLTTTEVCHITKKTCRPGPVEVSAALRTMSNIFECRLKDLGRYILDNIMKENKSSLAWSEFGFCVKKHNNSFGQGSLPDACFHNLTEACLQADVVVAKVLRMDISLTVKLMLRLPNLKVLHLFRDPRAIVNSRITTDWFQVYEDDPEGVKNNTEILCKKLESDHAAITNSFHLYPGRMYVAKLEALANETNIMKLVKFAEIETDKNVFSFINEMVTTSRENNIFSAWRNQLSIGFRTMVNAKCMHVLKQLNYDLNV